jgi:flagellar motor switch protein FliM
MKNITRKKDIRVEATFIIWGCATGMMAICIPLVSISKSGVILPLSVILGASTSTVAVWRRSEVKAVNLADDFQQIEQRIRNLETICSSEYFDATKKFK